MSGDISTMNPTLKIEHGYMLHYIKNILNEAKVEGAYYHGTLRITWNHC